jgi:hypothetical protein
MHAAFIHPSLATYPELVHGERDHAEAILLVLALEGLELRVLRREATLRGLGHERGSM